MSPPPSNAAITGSASNTKSGSGKKYTKKVVQHTSPAKTDPESVQWRLKRVQSMKVSRVDVWEKYVDPESHAPFYYNTLTEQTQWQLPEDYMASIEAMGSPDAKDGWKAVRDRSVCLTSNSSSMYLNIPLSSPSNTAVLNANLEPSVWEKYYDIESERYFYYNQTSGESTWENPDPESDIGRMNSWVECLDPNTNAVYYYNEMTGESAWELPTGAVIK